MIAFESSNKIDRDGRSADERVQQLRIFYAQSAKYRCNDIMSARITGSEIKLIQYTLATDAIIIGKLDDADSCRTGFQSVAIFKIP